MAPRVLIVTNEASFFLSHRLPIAIAARAAGFEVHVATMPGPAVHHVEAMGFAHHALPLTRSGTNPVRELNGLWSIFRLFRRLRPDLVHLVTIKPVLYGGLSARAAGVPSVVAAISGLGFVFTRDGLRAKVLRGFVAKLYRLAIGHSNIRVIVQNPDDRATLLRLGAVSEDRTTLIRGSGVDLSKCRFLPEPLGVPVVVMAARLLRDKGVFEFVEAAQLLRAAGIEARFWLAGDVDPGNPASVSSAQLVQWRKEGIVEILGHRVDIAEVFAASNVVVLPSYYGEGLPKVLMEAAACGRSIVTTDMPGCREAIEAGVTGLLIPPRDARALAAAIRQLLDDGETRAKMGEAGRALAEREFAVEGVVAAHIRIYRDLMQR